VRANKDPIDGLIELHRITDPAEFEATFRASMATLAALVLDSRRPLPLEGLDRSSVQLSVRAAYERGSFENLDFLSPPAAASALFELASALPQGDLKRKLGRDVLARLHQGSAETFVSLATQLASGSKRALAGTALRARMALAFDLSFAKLPRADALAFAILTRTELRREWLTQLSTGGLASRRLAARLVERAAGEAAARAAEGDSGALAVFRLHAVREAWDRLHADRESLVWRHVANARGYLSAAFPSWADHIRQDLDASNGITEWRRAAAALAASLAFRLDSAHEDAVRLFASELPSLDPGIAHAFVLGLARAADFAPAEVRTLMPKVVERGGHHTAEAIAIVMRECASVEPFEESRARLVTWLSGRLATERFADDGERALLESLAAELDAANAARKSLPALVDDALSVYVERGAADASAAARRAVQAAAARVGLLERADLETSEGRIKTFRALREIDVAILETDSLRHLLGLSARSEPAGDGHELAEIVARLERWIIAREETIDVEGPSIPHPTLHVRQLRSFLHLVDAELHPSEADTASPRERRLEATRVLLARLSVNKAAPLHRALAAASARALDGLMRDEIVEASDVLVLVSTFIRSPGDVQIMAEAALHPEIVGALRAYAGLVTTMLSLPEGGSGVRTALDAMSEMIEALSFASSARVEAFRRALIDLSRSLEAAARAPSIVELFDRDARSGGLASLAADLQAMSRLVRGSRARLGYASHSSQRLADRVHDLELALEAMLGNEAIDLEDPRRRLENAVRRALPGSIGDVVLLVVSRLATLPVHGSARSTESFRPIAKKEAPLPAWIPPSRILGAFYVLSPIGTGAGGTVFVARRADDRSERGFTRYALKVPDYSGGAARTLSESEFMQLFREEAGALLTLPSHPNLANFVTFDVAARPKPILVMEHVEGPHLERVLEAGRLSTSDAFRILDGIAAGLAAMHEVGLGHLDLKPSNVIVRAGNDARAGQPVLVDFGLAGRKVRPGCGTAEYGAPEVWTTAESRSATAADLYALGCLAYEVLTTKTLFEASSHMALVSQHVSHDGLPPGVAELGSIPGAAPLVEALRGMLRQRPNDRVSMQTARESLAKAALQLRDTRWPLVVHQHVVRGAS
jgi:eukaryotic-like serine/threonine-protein kinase